MAKKVIGNGAWSNIKADLNNNFDQIFAFMAAQGWNGEGETVSTFPNESKLMFFGDSITEEGNILNSNGTVALSSKGYTSFTQLLSGNKFNPLQFGKGGNTTANMISRLADAVAQQPKIVIILAGANDLLGNTSSADTIANLSQIYDAFRGIPNCKIIAIKILPTYDKDEFTYARDAGELQRMNEINAFIESQASADFKVVDATSKLTDNTFFRDGLHTNTSGAYEIAKLVYPLVVERQNGGSIWDIVLPQLNYTVNPTMTGSGGGVIGSGVTGTVADNWMLGVLDSNGATVVGSKAGDGKQVITISGNYTGSYKEIQLYQIFTSIIPIPGDILEGFLDYEIMGTLTNISSVHMQIQIMNAQYTPLTSQHGLTSADNVNPLSGPGRYQDRTATTPLGSGTPVNVVNRVRITLKDSEAQLPVSGQIKIYGAGVRKIN